MILVKGLCWDALSRIFNFQILISASKDMEEEEDGTEQEDHRLTDKMMECLDQVFEATLRRFFRKYSPLIPDMVIYTDTIAVIHKIDACARKGFPLFFLCLQAAYWTLYLHIL